MSITSEILSLRQLENQAIADIVRKVSYVDEHNLYKSEGYSSIFAYLTQCLGYSEGSAVRRMQAARYLAKHPEIYEKLREGKITLCAVLEIAKIKEEVPDVLSKIEGKTRSEVQQIAAEFLPPVAPKREVLKPIKVSRPVLNDSLFCSASAKKEIQEISYSVSFQASEKCFNLLTQVKAIIGPRSTADVFEKLLEDFVKRADLKRKGTVGNKNKRHITKTLRAAISERDNRQCTFMAASGRRCTETQALQIDHIKPFAIGGETEIDTLRLLCPSHNRHYAEQQFGNYRHKAAGSLKKNLEEISPKRLEPTS